MLTNLDKFGIIIKTTILRNFYGKKVDFIQYVS